MQRPLILFLGLSALLFNAKSGVKAQGDPPGCTGDRVYCKLCTAVASEAACDATVLQECTQADPVCRRVTDRNTFTGAVLAYSSSCVERSNCDPGRTGGGAVPDRITECQDFDSCVNGTTTPAPVCVFANNPYNEGDEVTKHPKHGTCKRCTCQANGTVACMPRPGADVDGRWGPWNSAGSCSKTCGPGVEQLTRMCIPPKCDGKPCEGESASTKPCNLKDCPEDCVCTVSGDPLTRTFDENWGLIEGTGEFYVAKSSKPGCTWQLSVQIEEVDGIRQMVAGIFRRNNVKYVADANGLKVNGNQEVMPYDVDNVRIELSPTGVYKMVVSGCNLKVTMEGQGLEARLTVTIDDRSGYDGKLMGMCGSCNGNPDDDVLLGTGGSIGTDEARFKRWSASWIR